MSAKAIFYDPQRKRWRRLRRGFDTLAVLLTIVLITFIYSLFRGADLGTLKLDEVKRPIHALKEKEQKHAKKPAVAHRKSKRPASQVVLNSGEGIRAAFYVVWDAGSFASLREYLPQIDILYPEWLHVTTNDGDIKSVTQLNKLFNIVQNSRIQTVDDKVMPLIRFEKADTEVLPLIN